MSEAGALSPPTRLLSVQIITVLDLLKGKRPDTPWDGSPFAKAPTEKEKAEQEAML